MKASIFADLDFEAGKARALAEDKLLLVAATSARSGTDDFSDATWNNAALVDLLAADFVSVQLDIDAHPALARTLFLKETPTIVVLRKGNESGRVEGHQTAEQLVDWLNHFPKSPAAIQRARAAVAANPADVERRNKLAFLLFATGSLDEAADELAFQWEHSPSAAREFPMNFLLSQLVQRHPPARERFEVFRTRLDPRDDAAPDPTTLAHWMCLNHLFEDDDATLSWFDRMRNQIDLRGSLGPVLFEQMVPVLMEKGRWAEAGMLLSDPMSELESTLLHPFVPLRRDKVGNLVHALCAAGREDEAAQVIERACSFDPSPEMDDAIARALPDDVLAAARAAGTESD